MTELKFSYRMELSFSRGASSNHFTFHCLPREEDGQHVVHLRWRVDPMDYCSVGTDGFGNRYLYGSTTTEHEKMTLTVDGWVQVDDSPKKDDREELEVLYRRQSPLTKPGPCILARLKEIGPWKEEREFARLAMEAIRGKMIYTKGSSDTSTTAEEAFGNGKGVCQDYAHVLLSLLRESHIPSRYTAGLIDGEGQTHAWVQFRTSSGWVGIDPTYGTFTDQRYIVFSVGQDASDCLVNKGILRLNGTQSMVVTAKTEEIQ